MPCKEKVPCFRGHVRKSVTPFGGTCWLSEVRTNAVYTDLARSGTVNEAIALAIQKAYEPAEAGLPLRQAAYRPFPFPPPADEAPTNLWRPYGAAGGYSGRAGAGVRGGLCI